MQKLIKRAEEAYPKMVYTLPVNVKNQVYPPESDTNFKENNLQQFTSPCNVNHRKM
jgi:hypothetical protein